MQENNANYLTNKTIIKALNKTKQKQLTKQLTIAKLESSKLVGPR